MRALALALSVLACSSNPAPVDGPPEPEPSAPVPDPAPPEDPTAGDGSIPEQVDAAAKAACDEQFRSALERDSPDHQPPKLLEAARCYEAAGAIGIAVRARDLIIGSFPASEEAPTALRENGQTYERIGHVADAARLYENYARTYASAPEAATLLEKATCFRLSFGDERTAAEDLALLEGTFGRKTTLEALCPDTKAP